MYSIEIIPFRNFKQKLKLMKEFKRSDCKITVYENYLYIDKFNYGRIDGSVNIDINRI